MLTEAQVYGGSRIEVLAVDPVLLPEGERFFIFRPPGAGRVLTLPDARRVTKTGGLIFLIHNLSAAESFDLEDNAGGFLTTVAVGDTLKIYLFDKSTQAGQWVFDGSRGVSTANEFSDDTKPPSFDADTITFDEN